MKNHEIGYIIAKPTDFKVCAKCSCFNWHENEECWNCSSESQGKFVRNSKLVKVFAQEELEFFQDTYDYTEEQALSEQVTTD